MEAESRPHETTRPTRATHTKGKIGDFSSVPYLSESLQGSLSANLCATGNIRASLLQDSCLARLPRLLRGRPHDDLAPRTEPSTLRHAAGEDRPVGSGMAIGNATRRQCSKATMGTRRHPVPSSCLNRRISNQECPITKGSNERCQRQTPAGGSIVALPCPLRIVALSHCRIVALSHSLFIHHFPDASF